MKFRLSLLAVTAIAMAGLGPLVACSSDEPTGTGGNSGTGGGTPSLGGSSGTGQGGQATGGGSGKATSGGTGGQGTGGSVTAGAGGSSGSAQAGNGTAGEDPCPNAGGMPAIAGTGAGGQGTAGMPAGAAGMSAGGMSGGAPSTGGMSGDGAGGRGDGGRGDGGRGFGGRNAGGASSGGMSAGGMSGMGTAGAGMAGTAGAGTAGSGTAGTGSEDPYPPTFENLKFVLTAPTPACTASDCHGVNGPNVFQMTTRDDDFLYNSLTTHYSVNCGMTVVVPGHPEQSALVKIIKGECVGPCKTTGRMPKDCTPEMETCLPDDMISSIEKWIAGGAPR